MNGRLLPTGWWHFLRRRRTSTAARRLPRRQARVPAHRRRGAALHRALRPGRDRPRRPGGEMGWILETNRAMNRGMEAMGGRIVKRYRMYERRLEPGAEPAFPAGLRGLEAGARGAVALGSMSEEPREELDVVEEVEGVIVVEETPALPARRSARRSSRPTARWPPRASWQAPRPRSSSRTGVRGRPRSAPRGSRARPAQPQRQCAGRRVDALLPRGRPPSEPPSVSAAAAAPGLTAELRPRWPFRLPRAGTDGVVRRRGAFLERLVHVEGRPVVVRAAQPSADRVVLRAAPSEEVTAQARAACEEAIARMRFALALDDDLRPFWESFRHDPLIGPSLRARPHLRVGRRTDPFEALAWAICEQLIEYSRAMVIERRIVARLGRRCERSALRDLPSAGTLAAVAPAELESLGLSAGRSLALRRAAREVASGRADLRGPDHERGVGAPAGDSRDRRLDDRRAGAARSGPLRPRTRRRPRLPEVGRAAAARATGRPRRRARGARAACAVRALGRAGRGPCAARRSGRRFASGHAAVGDGRRAGTAASRPGSVR